MKRKLLALLLLLSILCLSFVSCIDFDRNSGGNGGGGDENEREEVLGYASVEGIPDYSGSPYVELNGNKPEFSDEEKKTKTSYETYSKLDSLGRCGVTHACIGKDLMPTEDRESISSVKPSGWINKKYDTDLVDGGYLYNRCHLIGFQLTGENANERNLITGTRYMNVDGMLPFENMVADYIKETENHVMYRVTPIFVGRNLVASGVQVEAYSVEDHGDGICFNVFVYNVQPGIMINYLTGDSRLNEDADKLPDTSGKNEADRENQEENENNDSEEDVNANEKKTYILNTNRKLIHWPTCSSVPKISNSNKNVFTGTKQSLIDQGYQSCDICKP